jgi:hypothetical protein
MIIPYCLNIHPGETLEDIRSAITHHALRVKERIDPSGPYPLGLRFSAQSVIELSEADNLAFFKEFLISNNCYTTGINGFPYGAFHNTAVKKAVYQPDWGSKTRLNYTMKLCSILAELLPPGTDGSVTTVPLGYKTATDADSECVFIEHIVKCAEFLKMLYENTGKRVALALEPEPDCVIETGSEMITWFNRFYDAAEVVRDYVGICLDTCHAAVEFESPLETIHRLEAAQIKIARVQLSSAISATISLEALKVMSAFIDPVYLHQTRIRTADGSIHKYSDLTAETLADAALYTGGTLRTHFHVPLFFEGTKLLRTTHDDLSADFFSHVKTRGYPLEIETYTFDVLPKAIKPADIIDSLVMEHDWVTSRL